MNINLRPSQYYDQNKLGFKQIISEKTGNKEKTYLTLKKNNKENVVRISAKILKGPSGVWERFKNFFTGRYIEQSFVGDDDKNYKVFVKINDIFKRSYVASKTEENNIKHFIGANPEDLEESLVMGKLADIELSIKEKYEDDYYITEIPEVSSLAAGSTNKFDFKKSFFNEVLELNKNKEFKDFNVDPPIISIVYGLKMLKGATGNAFTLFKNFYDNPVGHPTYRDVNVWYDDREDKCYLLIKKNQKNASEKDSLKPNMLNKLLEQELGENPTNIS